MARAYDPFAGEDEDEDEELSLNVPVLPRKPFIKDFAKNYHAGQHATFLGPSGRGKTVLAGQLAGATVRSHPDITIRALHGKIKGRDQSIINFAHAADLTISAYPEPTWLQRKVMRRKSHGHVVRPLEQPGASAHEENTLIAGRFRQTIYRAYHASPKHPVILLVDEAHQAHNDLKLRLDCEAPLMRGRPVCGVWSLVQRGRHVSYMVYDQAEHLFIFFDPDRDNQRRYSEIGGTDPDVLVRLSRRLKTKTVADGSTISQALYFRRSGNFLAIVDT
jgi:energy-coupling factor transporter ATP-binding protein EcfA2